MNKKVKLNWKLIVFFFFQIFVFFLFLLLGKNVLHFIGVWLIVVLLSNVSPF